MVILTWVLSAVSVLGVGGAVAAMVFFPTVAVPVAEKIVQWLLGCAACLWVALVVLGALSSYWYGRHGQYERGHAAAVAEIAAEDEKAIANALEKRDVWQKCHDANGTWDQTTGDCK